MENYLRVLGGSSKVRNEMVKEMIKARIRDLIDSLTGASGSKKSGIFAPCDKCPYKLGKIKMPVSPCPKCKLTGYSTYYKWLKDK
ncbi:MAG: hypothetical protein HUJ86_02515 [Synergistes sp.]|nr:hypothetical protein [Synergistes sp.]